MDSSPRLPAAGDLRPLNASTVVPSVLVAVKSPLRRTRTHWHGRSSFDVPQPTESSMYYWQQPAPGVRARADRLAPALPGVQGLARRPRGSTPLPARHCANSPCLRRGPPQGRARAAPPHTTGSAPCACGSLQAATDLSPGVYRPFPPAPGLFVAHVNRSICGGSRCDPAMCTRPGISTAAADGSKQSLTACGPQ